MQFSSVFALVASAAAVNAFATNTTTTAVPANGTDVSITTVVTVTHCDENKTCYPTTSKALVSVSESTVPVGTTHYITQYTTWCPLPTEEPAAPVKPTTKAPVAPAPEKSTTAAGKPATEATPVESTVSASSTAELHQTFTGAAAKALPAVGALFAGAAALLL